MKKEVILAIAIGFGLGLVITFGIWTANKSLKQTPSSTEQTASSSSSPSTSPAPTPASGLSLTITSPDDESLNTTGSVTLTGKTAPNSSVAIISDLEEQIVTADSSGNFTATLDLDGGYNTITVSAFDNAGNSASQTLYVTYTTAKV